MKEKILVVEDEVNIRKIICMYLKKEGYDVVDTGLGKQALEFVKFEKPSLIILDVMLPDISGYEICKKIKGNNKTRDIIIFILSAKGQEREKAEGFLVGADYYKTKPFSPKQLITEINEIFKKKEYDV